MTNTFTRLILKDVEDKRRARVIASRRGLVTAEKSNGCRLECSVTLTGELADGDFVALCIYANGARSLQPLFGTVPEALAGELTNITQADTASVRTGDTRYEAERDTFDDDADVRLPGGTCVINVAA